MKHSKINTITPFTNDFRIMYFNSIKNFTYLLFKPYLKFSSQFLSHFRN